MTPPSDNTPLTPAEIDEWREAAEPGLALHLHRIVLRRFIATIDALNAELHLLGEGRRKLLEADSTVFSAALNELPFATTAEEPTFTGDFKDLRDASKAAAQVAFEREK